MSSKQGGFIAQLRQRRPETKRESFTWKEPIATAQRDRRLAGSVETRSPRASDAQPTTPTPTTLDGRIDKEAVTASLDKQHKRQRKEAQR